MNLLDFRCQMVQSRSKTMFTWCSLEERIEGKLRGHGRTDAKYRFCNDHFPFISIYCPNQLPETVDSIWSFSFYVPNQLSQKMFETRGPLGQTFKQTCLKYFDHAAKHLEQCFKHLKHLDQTFKNRLKHLDHLTKPLTHVCNMFSRWPTHFEIVWNMLNILPILPEHVWNISNRWSNICNNVWNS